MKFSCPIDITPYAQSGVVKTPPVINLNYASQDFWSLKARLIDFCMQRFGPQGTELPNSFNDLIESSLAVMLIENWAFLGDMLSFKMDQIVNELFIDTVTEKENIFRLAKLVGFQPSPPIAARSLWSASMNTPLESDVILTAPVSLDLRSNDHPITVELFQADSNMQPMFNHDIIIPAGQTINSSIVGLEGVTNEELFFGTGEISQVVQLNGPVIWDSVSVTVDGIEWTQVPFFTDSEPRTEYRVDFDSTWNAYVVFGNNRAGLIPTPGSQIQVRFRVGGGVNGNIVTGTIDTQKMATVPGLDYVVPVILRNYTKGEFGYDGDTMDDIRLKLPRYLKTQDRAVSGEDYKNLCDLFATPYNGQIGKSTATLRHHGCAGNVVDIYVLAKDGVDDLAKATNELKIALSEELNKKKMITDYICIRDGVVVYVDITVEVILDRFYRKFEEELRATISNRLTSFFSLNKWEYGKPLKDTDVIKSLSDIKQINSYVVELTTNDPDNSGSLVTTDYYEIIRPDTITLSFMYEQEG